jgi:hypothetical protein
MASLQESFSCQADPDRLTPSADPTPLSSLRLRTRPSRGSLRPQPDGRHPAGIPDPGHEAISDEPQALNERAVRVIRRVDNKLTGREFGEQLAVAEQVQRLIDQATSNLNLCQCYIGWCPWW